MCGRLDAQGVQHRGDHVDRVAVLLADLALGPDALGPDHHERVGDSAAIGLALPAPERRVAGVCPAPGVVVVGLGAAEILERGQVLLHVVGNVVEKLRFVHRADRAALGARAIVGDHHDQGVLVLADVLEEADQLADVVVRVFEVAGEHLHEAGEQPPLVVRQLAPILYVRIVPRQPGVRGDDPELLLANEHLVAIGVPALVEMALVPVGPFLRDVVGRVRGARAEVHEERLVRRGLLAVGDHRLGLFHEVRREVIALFRRGRRFDLMIVVDEIGVPLVRFPPKETVEALEAAPQRPAVIGAGGRLGFGRGQVPFAEGIGVVALLLQDLRQHAVLERHIAVAARIAGRALGNAGHGVGVVVAAREDARARGRAERRGVHVDVAQAVGGQGVQVRRADRAAEAPELAEASVVQHDEQHIGCALAGPVGLGPRRLGHVEGSADDSRKGLAWLVLPEWHGVLRVLTPTAGPGAAACVRLDARRSAAIG